MHDIFLLTLCHDLINLNHFAYESLKWGDCYWLFLLHGLPRKKSKRSSTYLVIFKNSTLVRRFIRKQHFRDTWPCSGRSLCVLGPLFPWWHVCNHSNKAKCPSLLLCHWPQICIGNTASGQNDRQDGGQRLSWHPALVYEYTCISNKLHTYYVGNVTVLHTYI